jgi:hypothetical protein
MAAAAAAPVAEIALAESFAVAAPSMFTAVELAPLAIEAGGFGAGLGAMEGFGALGGMEGLGALGGLEGLGMAGLEGISAAAPSLGQTVTSGVLSGGGGAGAAGINPAMVAQGQLNAVQAANSGIQQAANYGFSQPELLAMQRGQALAQNAPIIEQTAGYGLRSPMSSAVQNPVTGYDIASRGVPSAIPEALNVPNPAYSFGPQSTSGALRAGTGEGIKTAMTELPKAAPSGLQAGFQKALNFAKENPFSAASMGYNAYNLLKNSSKEEEEPEEYNGILTKYKMSPDFKGRQANPEDYQYTPKVYTNAAEGGIMQAYAGGGPVETGEMQFSAGGKARSGEAANKLAMDYYDSMTQKSNLPSMKSDVGIIFDTDPDTRSLDPLSAALIRQAKINKRANMQLPGVKRPTPLGRINLAPPNTKEQDGDVTEAAQGGVMQTQRYAEGGVTEDEEFGKLAELSKGSPTARPLTTAQFQGMQTHGKQIGESIQNAAAKADAGIKAFLSQPPMIVSLLKAIADATGLSQTGDGGITTMAPGPAEGSHPPGFMQANEGAKQGIVAGPAGAGPAGTGGRGNVGIGNGATASGVGTGIGGLGGMGGGLAAGGLSSLGGYAAGGNPRLLKGPGDGMSDNIPATIAGKQPARLADGEFVIPADVVSHLGNGSTEAGAKVLHAMMTKVRKERTGNPKQGKQINPRKFLPA